MCMLIFVVKLQIICVMQVITVGHYDIGFDIKSVVHCNNVC